MLDRYGNDIVPGAKVAFNYSGEVRLGVVTKVEPKEHKRGSGSYAWVHTTDNISVEHADDRNLTKKRVTKVKNKSSLVVV